MRSPAGSGVLVKAPKPGQDRRFDLPSIGPQTVEGVARAGLAGIAVVAGATIIAEPERLVAAADRANIFVVGVAGREPSDEPPRRAPHVFLVAGEESGDRLGAALMRGAHAARAGRVRFSGVGGAQMAAQGLPSLFPLGDLAIIGFAAIPASLPKILRAHPRDRRCRRSPPSRTCWSSSTVRNSPIAWRAACARAAPAIPIVDYVCPSVWAWRPGRARAMRAYVDHVLALLPFEPAAHAASWAGRPAPMSAIR